MQVTINPFAGLIGKKFRSKHTQEVGTVTDVKLQPKSKVFMKMSKYRKEYHVLLKLPDNNGLARSSGYPVSIFNATFTEVQ